MLRDVFQKKDVGEFTDEFEVYVPNHGTRIYVAEAETRLERTHYEAETAYISDYQEIKNNQAEKTGIYEQASFCSAGYKAGWLGCSEKNDLVWRDVYSCEGGEYQLTIGFISGENRNISVDVNGQKVQTVSVNSGGWQTVGKKTINVTLQQGWNQIRLSNPANWMPDIDYIEVKSNTSDLIEVEAQMPCTGSTYNLQGQKVKADDARHTIVIQNGKKVLRK